LIYTHIAEIGVVNPNRKRKTWTLWPIHAIINCNYSADIPGRELISHAVQSI
jgi:hypothetical protein